MFDLKVGDYTYGHNNLIIADANDGVLHTIQIGKYCSLAGNIKIYCGKYNHNYKSASTYPFHELHGANCEPNAWGKFDPIIGSDVWIGANVVILPGVEIGDGAVIASYSIVTRSVPPYSIVAGNPAAIKKFRFDTKTINRLLKLKWWDIPHEYLLTNLVPYINDVKLFIKQASMYKKNCLM